MSTAALTEAVFYILLSLDAPLHGYGIMQNVERLSGGRVRLAAGTLYGALTTLTERGWIEAVGEDEGRRKEYRITPEGRAAVRAELARLQELTALKLRRSMVGNVWFRKASSIQESISFTLRSILSSQSAQSSSS